MKVFLFFILATICVIKAEAQDIHFGSSEPTELTELKRGVTEIQNILLPIQQNVKNDFDAATHTSEIVNVKHDFYRTVRESKNKIRNIISEAEHNGKNVEHCFTLANDDLRNILKTFNKGLNECSDSYLPYVTELEHLVTRVLSGCDKLLEDINHVSLACDFINKQQQKECLAQRIPPIRKQLNTFRSQANTFKESADTIITEVAEIVLYCAQNLNTEAKENIEIVDYEAEQCVA